MNIDVQFKFSNGFLKQEVTLLPLSITSSITLAHSIHKIQCSLCTQRTTHVNTKFNIVLSTQIFVYFKISSDGTIKLKLNLYTVLLNLSEVGCITDFQDLTPGSFGSRFQTSKNSFMRVGYLGFSLPNTHPPKKQNQFFFYSQQLLSGYF